jgi:hypothetical protein
VAALLKTLQQIAKAAQQPSLRLACHFWLSRGGAGPAAEQIPDTTAASRT